MSSKKKTGIGDWIGGIKKAFELVQLLGEYLPEVIRIFKEVKPWIETFVAGIRALLELFNKDSARWFVQLAKMKRNAEDGGKPRLVAFRTSLWDAVGGDPAQKNPALYSDSAQ